MKPVQLPYTRADELEEKSKHELEEQARRQAERMRGYQADYNWGGSWGRWWYGDKTGSAPRKSRGSRRRRGRGQGHMGLGYDARRDMHATNSSSDSSDAEDPMSTIVDDRRSSQHCNGPVQVRAGAHQSGNVPVHPTGECDHVAHAQAISTPAVSVVSQPQTYQFASWSRSSPTQATHVPGTSLRQEKPVLRRSQTWTMPPSEPDDHQTCDQQPNADHAVAEEGRVDVNSKYFSPSPGIVVPPPTTPTPLMQPTARSNPRRANSFNSASTSGIVAATRAAMLANAGRAVVS